MPKNRPVNLSELRRIFDESLASIWSEWLDDGHDGSPFDEPVGEQADVSAAFNYDIGYIGGIADATGWSLDCPGVKEWRPD